MTQPDKPRCETCRWWADMRTDTRTHPAGVCRRYPPMPVTTEFAWRGATYMEADRAHGVWPITDTDDECGEHTPKETPDAR